jgi:hypothetical protein
MSAIGKEHTAEELRRLASECTDKARVATEIADPLNPDASLAVKNWSAAALTATQAWMTIERSPRR